MIIGNSVVQEMKGFAFDIVEEMHSSLLKQGITPIDFGIGDPKEPTPEFIRSVARESIEKNAKRGYPLYMGTYEYRKAVATWNKKRYNIDLNPDNEICACIGAKEMVFNLPNAFIEPGDYVLIPNPGYPPYLKGTLFARGIPYFMELNKDNNYLPDFESVPENIIKKTKMMWLNFPNSPTGKIAPHKYIQRAVEFARNHNILLINDECYSELYHDDKNKPISILEITKSGVLSINSLSKRSCMTGWRIGWIAGSSDLISAVKKLKTNIDSGMPYFIQDAAITALGDEQHVIELRNSFTAKRDLLVNAFESAGFEKCNPDGTFYIWQKLPKGVDDLELCKTLLKPEYAIVVTPGSLLGETINENNPGKGYLRLALVPSIDDCQKAVDRIKKAVSQRSNN